HRRHQSSRVARKWRKRRQRITTASTTTTTTSNTNPKALNTAPPNIARPTAWSSAQQRLHLLRDELRRLARRQARQLVHHLRVAADQHPERALLETLNDLAAGIRRAHHLALLARLDVAHVRNIHTRVLRDIRADTAREHHRHRKVRALRLRVERLREQLHRRLARTVG